MQVQPRYSSLDDLEQDFQRRIGATEDPLQKAELLAQKAEATVAFRNQEAENRLVDAWKKLALVDYPMAGKFPELVTGRTEEEIQQSAREVHERVSGLANQTAGADAFDQFRQTAQEMYGGRSPVGGGQAPGSAYVPPEQGEERWRNRWAQQFNDAPRDAYGVRMGIAPRDVDRYAQGRFVEHMKDRIAFWAAMTNSSFRGRR